jgi:ABC-type uncharacterized transport system permease subunit
MRRLCRALAALLIPAASLVVALSAVAGLVLIIGEDPGRALLTLVRGALGDPEGIGYTLFYATDYVFAGLAVALPFQAGLFNIGGEGQAALGGPRRRHVAEGVAVIVCGMLDGIARGHIGQSLRTLWTAPARHAA